METRFYRYRQNSSGGYYISEDYGAAVYVEATNAAEADTLAQQKGLYFDGVKKGFDCPCCGDRWIRAGHNGWPSYTADELYASRTKGMNRCEDDPSIVIYKADGTKELWRYA